MKIYFGADHRGLEMKDELKQLAVELGHDVEDMGASSYDKTDDYPDYATLVARAVSADPDRVRGVLLCGSGAGMDIVSNKFLGVRSVLAISPEHVSVAREDDDVNVLSLATDFTSKDIAKDILKDFLSTEFKGEERHIRRKNKIGKIEKEICQK